MLKISGIFLGESESIQVGEQIKLPLLE